MAKYALKGSRRTLPVGARIIGLADRSERIQVSVIVRRRAVADLRTRMSALASGERSAAYLTREEFAQKHGADSADIAAVRAFADGHGLSVQQEDAARRTVRLAGTVAQFCAAFGVELHHVEGFGGTYRGRTGDVELPEQLQGIIEAVLGLDNRPQAGTHFRLRPTAVSGDRRAGDASPTSYSPLQIASLYAYPDADGLGECVALIELGGGYRPADLSTYFEGLGVASPTVLAVSVDEGENAPTGEANGPDGEVMLDIEVVGAIAPKAKIAVYFAPNTDAGFLDAVTTAIHDSTNTPSVISISWGGPESSWTAQAMTAMDEAFQAAAAMGITVCVASGDNGSSDGTTDGSNHVDFPASSSHALACGGTRLTATASSISHETVWNDGKSGGASGGGVSTFFALPAWQAELRAIDAQGNATLLAMRGVPDVSGDADPQTGYDVRIDGSSTVIGGTSAVAPLWAALIARTNQLSGRAAGLIQPVIYKNPAALRDITQGNNGSFAAGPGWDACTGLGSPDGKALVKLL